MNPKAVAVGVVVDFFLTQFISIILSIMISLNHIDSGALLKSIPFLLTNMFIGLICTSIGAYVAAHIAGESVIKNSFYVGLASLVISFILFFVLSLTLTWYYILGIILTIPFSLFGGYLEKRSN